MDGLKPNEGNVHATNPASGLFGPVCDNNWDINDVSTFLKALALGSESVDDKV